MDRTEAPWWGQYGLCTFGSAGLLGRPLSLESVGFAMDRRPPVSSYRPEIDGLRAIAVLAVITLHFNEHLLPSGFLGVDVFFVISGFVITASLARHQESD